MTESKSSRRIVCAAIRQANGFVICGVRHFDTVMREQIQHSDLDWSRAEQGFMDQRGMFLNRKQALGVAEEANQIIRRCGGDDTELFSENLY